MVPGDDFFLDFITFYLKNVLSREAGDEYTPINLSPKIEYSEDEEKGQFLEITYNEQSDKSSLSSASHDGRESEEDLESHHVSEGEYKKYFENESVVFHLEQEAYKYLTNREVEYQSCYVNDDQARWLFQNSGMAIFKDIYTPPRVGGADSFSPPANSGEVSVSSSPASSQALEASQPFDRTGSPNVSPFSTPTSMGSPASLVGEAAVSPSTPGTPPNQGIGEIPIATPQSLPVAAAEAESPNSLESLVPVVGPSDGTQSFTQPNFIESFAPVITQEQIAEGSEVDDEGGVVLSFKKDVSERPTPYLPEGSVAGGQLSKGGKKTRKTRNPKKNRKTIKKNKKSRKNKTKKQKK